MPDNLIISLHSDFHFERFTSSQRFPTLVKKGMTDVLMLAGDICSISWYEDQKDTSNNGAIKFQKWIKRHAKLVGRIYIVTGNHEYYGNSINARIGRPEWMPDNVIVFEDGGTVYDDYCGVRFTGCTLWTDFNNNDPLAKLAVQSRLSDYRSITGSNGKLITADELYEIHLKQRKQLLETINNSPLPCAVITHHSPDDGLTIREPDELRHGFHCTGLFDQMQYPVLLWAFGHTHEGGGISWIPSINIRKYPHVGPNKEFTCIINQYGYANRLESKGYNPWHCDEIGLGRHPEYELNPNSLAKMRQRIPVLAQLREIAEPLQKALSSLVKMNGISSVGTCLYASIMLQKVLSKYGPDIEFTVCGGSPDSADARYEGEQGILGKDNQWHGHYWVGFELLDEQFVVDITADQFGYEEVVVMPSQYYGSVYVEGSRDTVARHVEELLLTDNYQVT